ncbi:EscU/YscU/HrcU family type III secretion system export apparatus switch protein [Chitinibacteraceae bacterium HSL-7]
MSEEKEEGRSEQPTPFKLKEARRKGNVKKSTDVLTFFSMLGGVAGALLYLSQLVKELLLSWQRLFTVAGSENVPIIALLSQTFVSAAYSVIPLLLSIVMATVAGSLLQTGFVFSAHPLKADFKRLNPIQGIKKLFSKRILVDLAKVLLKVVLFSLSVGFLLEAMVENMSVWGALSVTQAIEVLAWYGVRLTVLLCLLLALYAGLDYLITARQYNQQMKMSRREIRDEIKRHEGDPLIRRRLKELRNEAAKKARSLSAVGDADFILTNPTHISVAIRYRPDVIDAPVLVSKGAGKQALQIKKIAKKHKVPIVESRRLARRLFFSTRIGEAVDPVYFSEVAKVMLKFGLLGKKYKKKNGCIL